MDDFAAFILTHGRPDNVKTYRTLRAGGYTGRIVVLIDDTDKTADEYRAKYGDEVEVFDKASIAETFDTADNQEDMRTIVYARNACFDVAKRIGVRYFIQLDDDYLDFRYRFNSSYEWTTASISIKNLDHMFGLLLDFLKTTPITSIAMAQGGDFIGGQNGPYGQCITLSRKAMNSFVCDTERPIGFVGRINEDVNTYTRRASTGAIFMTANQVALNQVTTQQGSGGMTDVYLSSGTYIKSFYSVMFHPSSVTVQMMNSRSHPRIHHQVNSRRTTPMIIREDYRKATVE